MLLNILKRHWKVLYYKAVIILNLLLLMMDRPMEVGKYVKDIRQNMIIAVITDLLAYYFISKTIEIFAIATLCTAMVWYIICFFRNQDIKSKLAENLLIFFSVGTYLFCGLLIPNAVIGGLAYLCIITISVFITYRNYEYNVLSGLLSVIKT